MSNLPSGAVTFLLASPEGRGPGMEPLPSGEHTVEGRAAALIRQVVAAHGGVMFISRAADCCASFQAAPAALAAAVAAQRALTAAHAGHVAARVEFPFWTMAAHTGRAYPYGGVYVAPALTHSAHLLLGGLSCSRQQPSGPCAARCRPTSPSSLWAKAA
jgi:hypothetical protein